MGRKSKKNAFAINLVAHNHPKLPISEQYRLISYNILFSSIEKEINSIVITSPEPSDGKSTTAVNIAIVLAQQGKKTLIIDADLRKPSIHHSFNISNVKGLSTLIMNQIDMDLAISKTYIQNLDVLPSGPIPPNPTELLNSMSMETIIEQFKREYEYIIFDTSPVLAVADPHILAQKCDGIIMVVKSGKTKKSSAIKAKNILLNSKGYFLGVVMNGEKKMQDFYYYQ